MKVNKIHIYKVGTIFPSQEIKCKNRDIKHLGELIKKYESENKIVKVFYSMN